MIGRTSPLDPNELEQAFRRHAKSLDVSCAAAPSRFIAIDGKTLRQSFDAFADRKAAHVLSAFAVDHRIILAHEVIDEKSNEIPTAQALIAAMGLSDASSRSTPCTAKKTFEIARETGNELIVQVKANQPGLLQRCEHIAATAAPIAVDDNRNLARNRQDDRRVEVYAPGAALDDDEWAPLIAAIVRVSSLSVIVTHG